MKLDRNKLQIAMARACLSVTDLVSTSKLPRPTVNNAIYGRSVRPATVGRIAKALNVDVIEITKEE